MASKLKGTGAPRGTASPSDDSELCSTLCAPSTARRFGINCCASQSLSLDTYLGIFIAFIAWMTLGDSEDRPRKRARYSPEPEAAPCRRLILEEIDLELALRERLVSTVQSRITWAMLLQEELRKELSHSGA